MKLTLIKLCLPALAGLSIGLSILLPGAHSSVFSQEATPEVEQPASTEPPTETSTPTPTETPALTPADVITEMPTALPVETSMETFTPAALSTIGETTTSTPVETATAVPTATSDSMGALAINASLAVGAGIGTCNETVLNASIASAYVGATITFNCGPDPVTILLTRTLVIRNPLTIDGGNRVTLSGGGAVTVIQNYSSGLTLQNLTIADGYSNGGDRVHIFGGGGVLGMWQANLTVINCRFNNNVTNNAYLQPNNPILNEDHGGGAIYNHTGTLNVRDSVFTNNRAYNSSGGAIHALWSNVSITNTTFENNQATGFGGAFYNDGVLNPSTNGYIRISNSRFYNNTAQGQGGGAFFWLYSYDNPAQTGSSVTVDTSVFSGNRVTANWSGSGLGGGIRAGNGPVTITNSTLSGNSASHQGGAIWMGDNGEMNLRNLTISGNIAQNGTNRVGLGGGLALNNSRPVSIQSVTLAENHAGDQGGAIYSSTTPVTLQNTLLYNNTASNPWGINVTCGVTYQNGGNNLQFPFAESTDRRCTSNIRIADPLLQPLANNGGSTFTRALSLGSPAIDSGVCTLATDQRGVTRPQGNACDIGAYEANGAISTSTPTQTFTPTATATPTATLIAPPGLVTLNPPTNTSSLRPTFHWTLTGSAATATYFNLVVSPTSNVNAPSINVWISRTDACASPNGTTCSMVAPSDLGDAVAYAAFMRSYGPGGYSTGGISGYAGPQNFTVDAAAPALPGGITVNNNQGRATFSWNNDANATYFNLYVTNNAGAVQLNAWYTRASVCPTSTCSVAPVLNLANGSYQARVKAWGPGGFSTGGAANDGYGGPVAFTFNFAAPNIAEITTFNPNGTITTGVPTFTWNTVAGTTYYLLVVTGPSPSFSPSYLNQWYDAATICTPHPGTCTVANAVGLGLGSYAWRGQAYGPGGISALSPATSFTIGVSVPRTLTLTSPTNTITNPSPSFIWNDNPAVDWYNVYVNTSTTIVLNAWYRAQRGPAQLCNAGICTLSVPGLTLANGAYTWNARGYNPAGTGPWAAGINFSVNVPAPGVPAPQTPLDGEIINTTNRPTFVWNTRTYAQWYHIEVRNSTNVVVFEQWVQANVGGCNASTCTVQVTNPLAGGNYTWRVQAWNQGGLGAFSAPRSFFSL